MFFFPFANIPAGHKPDFLFPKGLAAIIDMGEFRMLGYGLHIQEKCVLKRIHEIDVKLVNNDRPIAIPQGAAAFPGEVYG